MPIIPVVNGTIIPNAWFTDVQTGIFGGTAGQIWVASGSSGVGVWVNPASITVGNATNAVNSTNATNAVNATTATNAVNASNVTTTISSGVTATTQTTGDNSTKVATTAFVRNSVENSVFGYRNHIINGDFSVIQRYEASGTGAVPAGTSAYVFDRWKCNAAAGVVITGTKGIVADGAGTVSPGTETYGIFTFTNSGGGVAGSIVSQPIEGLKKFSAKEVTFAVDVTSSVSQTVTMFITEKFGTGGSPSANITRSNPVALTANVWTRIIFTTTLTNTAGKVFGSNNDDSLEVGLTVASTSTHNVLMSRAQLEIGAIPTNFELIPVGDTLLRCKRYYEKSAQLGVNPAATFPWGVNQIANLGTVQTGNAGSVGYQTLTARYTVPKRSTPSLLIADALGTLGKCSGYNGAWSNGLTPTSIQTSESDFNVTFTSGVSLFAFRWVAESEL